MDIGKVLSEFGHILEYLGVTGTPGGIWALMGFSGERERQPGQAVRPLPLWSELD